MAENNKPLFVIGVIIVIIVAFSALLASSFSYMEYYEMGFKRRKSTGNVDTSRVYTTGRYAVGPDAEFKIFSSVAHFVNLTNVAIFTSDRLEVTLSVYFQYFLRESDLQLLHENYDLDYQPIIENSALDAVKVKATEFSLEEYITSRARVEQDLHNVVKQRLGGNCCENNCQEAEGGCDEGCIPYDQCSEADKGFFVTAKYFQMGPISIPADVANRRLQNLILLEQTEQADFLRQAEIVRKETERQVQETYNEANEITNFANANASYIATVAATNATTIRESARGSGLQIMFDRLNLADEDYRRSFDYLRSLRDLTNVHLSVDFDQLVTGQFGST